MQNRGQVDSSANYIAKQGPGDMIMDQKKAFAITTAGAGVIPPEAILSGIVDRSGPGANFNDTLPSAAALLAACPVLTQGDSFEFLYINGVAFVPTLVAPADGSAVIVNGAISASLIKRFMITILSAAGVGNAQGLGAGATPNNQGGVFSASTTNGQPAVQLSVRDAKNVGIGMGVSGAGIPGGTTVVAVNLNTGVVTLSANATATAAIVGLTFFPRYAIRGLYQAAA